MNEQPTAFPGMMHPGLTIRQYYAAKAMQAMISDPSLTQLADQMGSERWIKQVASQSFLYADAMIAHETTTPDDEAKTEAP